MYIVCILKCPRYDEAKAQNTCDQMLLRIVFERSTDKKDNFIEYFHVAGPSVPPTPRPLFSFSYLLPLLPFHPSAVACFRYI